MKLILLLCIITTLAFSQSWNKIETPGKTHYFSKIDGNKNCIYAIHDFSIFKSIDKGKTWSECFNNLMNFENVGSLNEICFYNNTIYLLTKTEMSVGYESQLFKSTDEGNTWAKINIGFTSISELNIINSNIYLYSFHEQSMIYSKDNGDTWEILKNKETNLNYELIFKKNDTIILGDKTADNDNNSSVGIKISTDNGLTWNISNQGLNKNGITGVNMLGELLFASTRIGMFKSTDFGDSWRLSNVGLNGKSVWIKYLENINDTLYIGTQAGLFYSSDSANSWKLVDTIFENSNIHFFHYRNGIFFISYKDKNGNLYSIKSNDKFQSYNTLVYKKPLFIMNYIEDNERILSSSNGMYINRDNDYDLISEFFNARLDYIRYTKKKGKIIVAQLGSNLPFGFNETIISIDNGKSWQISDLNKEKKALVVGYFINEENTIYVFTENYGILYSTDLGLSWNDVEVKNDYINSKLSNLYGNGFSESICFENDSIYIFLESSLIRTDTKLNEFVEVLDTAAYNYIGNKFIRKTRNSTKYQNFMSAYFEDASTLYFSYDYGETWKKSEFDFGGNTPNLKIYDLLQFGKYLFVTSAFGVYYTSDLGESWEEINFNLSRNDIFSTKKLFNYGNKLYLSSSYGFYTIDLDELGIITSVEKRNALYQYPPFPQPSINEVYIRTLWDSHEINFSIDDVEIYRLNGEFINTKGKLSIVKDAQNKGNIRWDNSGEKPGIYIVKTKHGTETLITKIMITR